MKLPMGNEARYALIVVDMQRDGIEPSGTIYVDGAYSIVPKVGEMTAAARQCGIRVIHSQHAHRDDGSDFGISGFFEPLSCIEGTPGMEFYPDMEPQQGDLIIQKRRYSVFRGTDLDLLLRSQNISGLFLTGIQTDACVLSTVVEARNLDYKVWMVADALAGTTPLLHEHALEVCRHYFADVVDSQDVIEFMHSIA